MQDEVVIGKEIARTNRQEVAPTLVAHRLGNKACTHTREALQDTIPQALKN